MSIELIAQDVVQHLTEAADWIAEHPENEVYSGIVATSVLEASQVIRRLLDKQRVLDQELDHYKNPTAYKVRVPFPRTIPTQEMLDDDIVWTAIIKKSLAELMNGNAPTLVSAELVDDVVSTESVQQAEMWDAMVRSAGWVDDTITNGDTPIKDG